MGSGQSKLGFGKQKPQYPFPMPVFPGYGGQYPQPFIPQYGLAGYPPLPPPPFPQQQMPQQGFIPPGVYGPGGPGGFVPPQPPSRPRGTQRDRRSKKRRSSRRTHSENFVGGFAAEARAQAEAEPRRTHSESHHRNNGPSMPVPEIPRSTTNTRRQTSVSNRAPTPFIPASRRDDEDYEEEDHERDIPRGNSRQSNIRYTEPLRIDGNIRNVLRPVELGSKASYGPPGPRPSTPLKNPLPEPPRDVFDMTPYRGVATLPHATALLAGPYGPHSLSFTHAAAEMDLLSSSKVKRNNTVKGILRAFSRKDKPKDKSKEPERVYVPVFVEPQSSTQNPSSSQMPQPQPPNAQGTIFQVNIPQPQVPQPQIPPTTQQPDLQRSVSQHSRNPSGLQMPQPEFPSTPRNNVQISGLSDTSPISDSSSAVTVPIPPAPTSPPPVRFGQSDSLNGFLNHSVYRVPYRGKMYPTGLHLYEAMKFIDNRPDIAETIRTCPDVHRVYSLAEQYAQFERPDWGSVYIKCMEEVITEKVLQHADLRMHLMGTGSARIQYTDEHDEFWGLGRTGQGRNMLGKVMMAVRENLRDTLP